MILFMRFAIRVAYPDILRHSCPQVKVERENAVEKHERLRPTAANNRPNGLGRALEPRDPQLAGVEEAGSFKHLQESLSRNGAVPSLGPHGARASGARSGQRAGQRLIGLAYLVGHLHAPAGLKHPEGFGQGARLVLHQVVHPV